MVGPPYVKIIKFEIAGKLFYLHFFMWTTFFSFFPLNSDSRTLFCKIHEITLVRV
ncbi:hypothetical protein OIU84_005338 [Salix udensis]|uniref:Uncharacterized protein n=1 Tax=Salix udensis TaxID=889485 RepID=A0AAD6P0N1_9ROSI|nr:hypothetical protein OIU84_005338 [Salix udensis]